MWPQMKVSLQIRLHALVFLLTLLLLAGHNYLPLKTLDLLSDNSEIAAYADGFQSGGKSQATWVDINKRQFICSIKNGVTHKYCGVAIKYKNAAGKYTALDLRGYDSLYLHLDYEGPQERLIFFYRNTDFSLQARDKDPNSFQKDQYMFTYLDKHELNKPIKIKLVNFDIADWWLQQNYTNRKQIHRGLERVIEFGINTYDAPVASGEYFFTLKKLQAQGQWITKETLYFYIVLMWLMVALFEGLYWAVHLAKDKRRYKKNLDILTEDFKSLEDSALKDHLTEIYNRAGLLKLLDRIKSNGDLENYYLFVLDVDNFKVINDTQGHDAGDSILCQLVKVINENVRDEDVFSRWGGEEFVLITHQKTPAYALQFANKLREIVARIDFPLAEAKTLKVTISIGVSRFENNMDFDSVFKVADQCLYEAKRRGRNLVVLDKSITR